MCEYLGDSKITQKDKQFEKRIVLKFNEKSYVTLFCSFSILFGMFSLFFLTFNSLNNQVI
jgi:hypothetical protein